MSRKKKTDNIKSSIINEIPLVSIEKNDDIIQNKMEKNLSQKDNKDINYNQSPKISKSKKKKERTNREEPEELINQKQETKIEEKKGIPLTCPKCGTDFLLDQGEEAKCPSCNGALFECSECGAVVEETMKQCPKCGLMFEGVESSSVPGKEGVIVCSACNSELNDRNTSHSCTVCGKVFCDRCIGHHIPPDPQRLEAKIQYSFKLKDSLIWSNGTERLYLMLPEPLCNDCYTTEFKKRVERLKILSKQWREDQMHEMSIKIIKEEYPESIDLQKMKLVKSAQAFLTTIGSRQH